MSEPMKYPTMEEAEDADREQLGTWVRFLRSPGISCLDSLPDSDAVNAIEAEKVRIWEAGILDVIESRFNRGAGWTPGLSKKIGWEHP